MYGGSLLLRVTSLEYLLFIVQRFSIDIMESPTKDIQEPPKVKVKYGKYKEQNSHSALLKGSPGQTPTQQAAPPHEPVAHGCPEKSGEIEAVPAKTPKTDQKVSPNANTAKAKSTSVGESTCSSATPVPAVEQDVERGSSLTAKIPPEKVSRARMVVISIQISLLIAQLTLIAVDWHIYRSILRLPGHPGRIFRHGALVLINFLYLILCDCGRPTFPAMSVLYLVMGLGWFMIVARDSRALKDEVSACGPADEPCLAIWAFYHTLGWDYLAIGCATL